MKVIPYILYLLLVGAYVVALRELTSIYGITINLPALLVFLVALYKDDIVAAWFAFMVGLVAFAGLPGRFAWQALVLAVLALVACTFRERLNLDSLKARMLLVVGGVLVHSFIVMLINRTTGSPLEMVSTLLLGTLYTGVVAWLFFLFKERIVTIEKIKAIF